MLKIPRPSTAMTLEMTSSGWKYIHFCLSAITNVHIAFISWHRLSNDWNVRSVKSIRQSVVNTTNAMKLSVFVLLLFDLRIVLRLFCNNRKIRFETVSEEKMQGQEQRIWKQLPKAKGRERHHEQGEEFHSDRKTLRVKKNNRERRMKRATDEESNGWEKRIPRAYAILHKMRWVDIECYYPMWSFNETHFNKLEMAQHLSELFTWHWQFTLD